MSQMYKALAISTIAMLGLDAIYITINQNAFKTQIADIQRVALQFRTLGAVWCYILLVLGLYYFIISKRRPLWEAFLLGIVIYGVYDSTNYTLFKKWDIKLALMDMLWGGILLSLTTGITYYFIHP